MICIQFAGCNHVAVMSMLTLALMCNGLATGGFIVNLIDLSPNFAGKISSPNFAGKISSPNFAG